MGREIRLTIFACCDKSAGRRLGRRQSGALGVAANSTGSSPDPWGWSSAGEDELTSNQVRSRRFRSVLQRLSSLIARKWTAMVLRTGKMSNERETRCCSCEMEGRSTLLVPFEQLFDKSTVARGSPYLSRRKYI